MSKDQVAGLSFGYSGGAEYLPKPGRRLFVCTGDGAMQMTCNSELVTVAKYNKEWQDLADAFCREGSKAPIAFI